MKTNKGGKMKPEKLFKKCTLKIDGMVSAFDAGIITSENDESTGKYCPYCGKTEFESVRMPECTKIYVNPQEDDPHQEWSLDICTCEACQLRWYLFADATGCRVLVYETEQSAGIDAMGDIG
jgi:hypothetical protein